MVCNVGAFTGDQSVTWLTWLTWLTWTKDHLVPAAAKRAYLTLPNTLNSVALEKTVIGSSRLESCVNADDQEIIAEKTRGFRRYSKDNCEINSL